MRTTSTSTVLPMLMLGTSSPKVAPLSILISKYGRVKYHAANGDKQKIVPGAVILNTGKLKLSQNAAALIFSNGQFIRLDEKGVHSLEEVVPIGGMQKLNFDSRFSHYINAAIDLVVHAGEGDAWGKLGGSKGSGDAWGKLGGSKGSGDAWGKIGGSKGSGDAWGKLGGSKGSGDAWGKLGGSKGSGDAWGDKEGRIVPILPFGRIPVEAVVFQWSQPQISQSYTLEILDDSGGIVYSGEVKDNWTQVNFKTLPLKSDTTYAWRINVPDHPEKMSTKARIILSEQNAEELIEEKLKKSDAYQLEDPVLSGLMEAVVLEEAAHFYEAHQRYERLRQMHKKNNLVKLMQAAFYLRYQLKPRAQQLFLKKKKN